MMFQTRREVAFVSRRFVTLGLVTLLMGIGLSGCTSVDTITIRDIREHPEYYLNQTVMVRAMYSGASIIDDTGCMIEIMIPAMVVKPVPFRPGSYYTFTGIVMYGDISYYANETLYLEIKKIEV